MSVRSVGFAFAGALFCAAVVGSASAQVDEGPANVRVIARAQMKGGDPPTLSASQVKVSFAGHDTPVTRLQPLLGSGGSGQRVEVALLIDDGLRSNFGLQLRDLEQFVTTTVSPSVALGVGYMRNGHVDFPAGFSTEAEQELKAIRIPMSMAGINGSPYFCLQDLVKNWPTNSNAARVVIMITNGIDAYNGSVSPMNQNSPYVDQAIRDAQKAGVPVYSIYFGRREMSGRLASFSGQSYLAQMADSTGGITFNGGQINPVSIAPYFKQFNDALRESYVLTFQTGSRRMADLKLSSSVSGVKLKAQQTAGIQGAK